MSKPLRLRNAICCLALLMVGASGALAAATDATTVADLHRKFWPGQPLASIVYEHYSLCTLTS